MLVESLSVLNILGEGKIAEVAGHLYKTTNMSYMKNDTEGHG
jgi:hypothetical protein